MAIFLINLAANFTPCIYVANQRKITTWFRKFLELQREDFLLQLVPFTIFLLRI